MFGHTYLARPGMWIARGSVSDQHENESRVDVVFTIAHKGDEWVVDEVWQYLDGTDAQLHMVAHIIMLDPREKLSATSITYQHPIIGKAVGKVYFAFDSILMHFTSTASQATGGAMTFTRKSANDYIVRGYLVKDSTKYVAWTFEMMFSG